MAWKYDFKPLPKQREALIADVDEVLYGGSLGSGKSEVLLAACMTLLTVVPGSKALLVRRTYPELGELVKRLRERIPEKVARFNKSDYIFYFANGSELVLGYLNNEEDATRYQGHEFQLVCFDELTHYDKKSYVLLMSRLRATGKVLARMKLLGMKLRALSASNPGSKGHGWVKARFIDPAPKHTAFTGTEKGDHTTRIFIPARIYDNPFLDHEDYLRKLGPMDPELKRALVEGDWDVTSGVRFSQWRESIHVIKPEELPLHMLGDVRCVGVDYGFSAPFAAVWMAKLADGLIVIYREAYATELTATQQAQLILDSEAPGERDAGHHIPVVMDPAMWRRNDSSAHKTLDPDAPPVGSPAHDYQRVIGQRPVRGMNNRKFGASLFDEKLAVQGDGLPRLLVYDTCRDFIRTFAALPRAKADMEDVDTHAEDHLYDGSRYGLAHLAGKLGTGDKQEDHTPPAAAQQTLTSHLSPSDF